MTTLKSMRVSQLIELPISEWRKISNHIIELKEEIQKLRSFNHQRIFVQYQGKSLCIIEIDILYIKAESNYSMIHLKNGRNILSCKTLKHWEAHLNSTIFIRSHSSYLINSNEIKYLEKSKMEICMVDDNLLPISKAKAKSVWQQLL